MSETNLANVDRLARLPLLYSVSEDEFNLQRRSGPRRIEEILQWGSEEVDLPAVAYHSRAEVSKVL